MANFVAFDTLSSGRGLRAARALKPGEEVFRELPAACAWSRPDGNDFADVIDMLSQIILASISTRYRKPFAALLSHEEVLGEKDPALLKEVADHATPAVRRNIAESDPACACLVTKAAVITAYCKHLVNSMSVVNGETFAQRGTALYPGAWEIHLYSASYEHVVHPLSTPAAPDAWLTLCMLLHLLAQNMQRC